MIDRLAAISFTASAVTVAFGMALLFAPTWRGRAAILVGLGAWFVAVVAAGATRALHYDGGLGVPGLAAAIVVPLVLLCVLVLGTRDGRAALAAAPLPGLVALQGVRVLGVFFLLLHAAGRLPAPFATSAGWGDIVVGVLALPVAALAAGGLVRAPLRRLAVLAWSALGVLDLVAAVALGAMSSPGPVRVFVGEPSSAMMTTLPWTLVPCFVVPLLLALHAVTVRRLLGEATPAPRALPGAMRAA